MNFIMIPCTKHHKHPNICAQSCQYGLESFSAKLNWLANYWRRRERERKKPPSNFSPENIDTHWNWNKIAFHRRHTQYQMFLRLNWYIFVCYFFVRSIVCSDCCLPSYLKCLQSMWVRQFIKTITLDEYWTSRHLETNGNIQLKLKPSR